MAFYLLEWQLETACVFFRPEITVVMAYTVEE